jgi:WD40 repeat protein
VAVVSLLLACSVQQIRSDETLAVFKTVAFSPDGKSIAAARNVSNVIFVYDATTLKRRTVLLGRQVDFASTHYFARSLAFSPDSKQIATPGIDDSFVIWNAVTGEEAVRISELKGAMDVAFSPAGDLLATAGPGNDVLLWSLAEAKVRATLKGHAAQVTAVAFSADGKLMASGSADKTVRLWTVEGHQQVAVLAGHAYPVHSLSFSRDAALVAAYAGELRLWELASGHALAPVLAKVDTSTAEGFAMLASILGAAASIHVSGAPVVGGLPLGVFNPDARAAADRYPAIFSPDGKRLAVMRFNPGLSGDHEIVLLDVRSKATVARIQCQCFTMAFSPDGTRLATGGNGVRLWDAETGKEVTPSR